MGPAAAAAAAAAGATLDPGLGIDATGGRDDGAARAACAAEPDGAGRKGLAGHLPPTGIWEFAQQLLDDFTGSAAAERAICDGGDATAEMQDGEETPVLTGEVARREGGESPSDGRGDGARAASANDNDSESEDTAGAGARAQTEGRRATRFVGAPIGVDDDAPDDDDDARLEAECFGAAADDDDATGRDEVDDGGGEDPRMQNKLRRWAAGEVVRGVEDNWHLKAGSGAWTPIVRTVSDYLGTWTVQGAEAPLPEWAVRALMLHLSIRKWLKIKAAGLAVKPLDLFWAAVALLQDEGQVDCQVMRGEVSSRTKRYEPEWRYSLMLSRELHTGAPTADPAPHGASGMRHHDSLKLMTGIMARGPNWYSPMTRVLRRSVSALRDAAHCLTGSSVESPAAYTVAQAFLLARIAAGHIHCDEFIPPDGEHGLDRFAAGQYRHGAGLSPEQLRILRMARDGVTVLPAATARRAGAAAALSTDGIGRHVATAAPDPADHSDFVLVLLGCVPSGQRGTWFKVTAARWGIKLVTVGKGEKRTSLNGVHIDVSLYTDADMRGRLADELLNIMAPYQAAEVAVISDDWSIGPGVGRGAGGSGVVNVAGLVERLRRRRRGELTVVVPRVGPNAGSREPHGEACGVGSCPSLYFWLRVEERETNEPRGASIDEAWGAGEWSDWWARDGTPRYDPTCVAHVAVYGRADTHGIGQLHAMDAMRRAWRRRGDAQVSDAVPRCQGCMAKEAWYFGDEHPQPSTRRRTANPFSQTRLTEDTFCQCAAECVLRKATSAVGSAYGPHRTCFLKVCGGKHRCGRLTIPPREPGKGAGRHLWVIGGSRGVGGAGRATTFMDFKHHVPQLYFADLAHAVAAREGDGYAAGMYWISICSGGHSDRIAAMLAGYRYVPLDIRRLVVAFGAEEPNHGLDAVLMDIYDYLAEVLGGELELLHTGVVHSFVPCDTNSPLNPGMHRDDDGNAITEAAIRVDEINANLKRFLRKLCLLKRNHVATCTCGRAVHGDGGGSAGARRQPTTAADAGGGGDEPADVAAGESEHEVHDADDDYDYDMSDEGASRGKGGAGAADSRDAAVAGAGPSGVRATDDGQIPEPDAAACDAADKHRITQLVALRELFTCPEDTTMDDVRRLEASGGNISVYFQPDVLVEHRKMKEMDREEHLYDMRLELERLIGNIHAANMLDAAAAQAAQGEAARPAGDNAEPMLGTAALI